MRRKLFQGWLTDIRWFLMGFAATAAWFGHPALAAPEAEPMKIGLLRRAMEELNQKEVNLPVVRRWQAKVLFNKWNTAADSPNYLSLDEFDQAVRKALGLTDHDTTDARARAVDALLDKIVGKSFNEISPNNDKQITIEEFSYFADRAEKDITASNNDAYWLARFLEGNVLKYWADIVSNGDDSSPLKAAIAAINLAMREEAKAAKLKKPTSGKGFIATEGVRGLVIAGDKTELVKNPAADAVILRVTSKMNDTFHSSLLNVGDGGTGAKPAIFSYEKSEGTDKAISLTGALRFEWRRSHWLQATEKHSLPARKDLYFLPIGGVEFERSGTGDKKVDVRRYFAQAMIYKVHGSGDNVGKGFLSGSTLLLGPVYETDLAHDVDRLSILAEYQPLLRVGRYATNTWNYLGRGVEFMIAPRIGIEAGNVRRAPSTFTAPGNDFYRLGLRTGIRLFDQRLTILYDRINRYGFGSTSRNAAYHEYSVDWALDSQKVYSLAFLYKGGENSPTFVHVKNYKFGLGINY